MKIYARFLFVSLLLALALACMFFSAAGTIQAYQQFKQSHQLVMKGDVSTISPWMTLPYVARIYHVPEACLYQSLHLSKSNAWPTRHTTLLAIADRNKRPVKQVILEVQHVILNYRQHHIICTSPPESKSTGVFSPTPLLKEGSR